MESLNHQKPVSFNYYAMYIRKLFFDLAAIIFLEEIV